MTTPLLQSSRIGGLSALAIAMHANRGCYALLLGSGISRAAGIPTGFEVVNELVAKLARLEGISPDELPLEWYERIHGHPPSYSSLLETIGTTEDIRGLLRPLFEPTETDLDMGLKQPTQAHQAVAQLVRSGHIRVIVTTNFDRLMEQALNSEGLAASVICTPDQALGATPLAHSRCTIVKLNGDYLDSPLKNLPGELDTIGPAFDKLLDQIFDEYGLIVCGWSGAHDVALKRALDRCPSRRYLTIWASVGPLSDDAQRIVVQRGGRAIEVAHADGFFCQLEEKLHSLDDLTSVEPLSTETAVATLRRYLPDSRQRIRKHELVNREVERAIAQMTLDSFPVQGGPGRLLAEATIENYRARMQRYEALIEVSLHLAANGCYWDDSDDALWVQILDRLLNHSPATDGMDLWLKLQSYPGYLMLYISGIASLAAERPQRLYRLLTQCEHRTRYGTYPVWSAFTLNTAVLDHDLINAILAEGGGTFKLPRSRYLLHYLREPLRAFLPDDTMYSRFFDMFEYVTALIQADLSSQSGRGAAFWPGRFAMQIHNHRDSDPIPTIEQIFVADFDKQQDQLPLLKSGAFAGDVERIRAAIDVVHEQVMQWRWLHNWS